GRSASAAPGKLTTPAVATVRGELDRANGLIKGLSLSKPMELIVSGGGNGPPGSAAALEKLLAALSTEAKLAPLSAPPALLRKDFDPQARLKRLFDQINDDTQHLMREGEYVRADLWSKADRTSRDLAKWSASTEQYRKHFYDEVIGRFDRPLLPPNARSRQ